MEGRLPDPSTTCPVGARVFEVGDILHLKSGDGAHAEEFKMRITEISWFPTFEAMIRAVGVAPLLPDIAADKKHFGVGEAGIQEAVRTYQEIGAVNKYNGLTYPEREAQFGVLGIHLAPLV